MIQRKRPLANMTNDPHGKDMPDLVRSNQNEQEKKPHAISIWFIK